MGVPPNVHLLQAALAAQNPGAAMAPTPEPPPAVRAMDVVWSVNNPDDRGEHRSLHHKQHDAIHEGILQDDEVPAAQLALAGATEPHCLGRSKCF